MHTRLNSELKRFSIIISLGILYYIWVLLTDLKIPCVFNLCTGLLCPACGVTRMIISATKLDFVAAYSFNRLLFVSWPLIAIPFAVSEYNYIKSGTRSPGKTVVLLWIEIGLLIVFGIIRNII